MKNLEYLKALKFIGNSVSNSSNDLDSESEINLSLDQPGLGLTMGSFSVNLNEAVKVNCEISDFPVSETLSASVLRITIINEEPVELKRLSLKLKFEPTVAMEQGFQSWSPVRVVDVDDLRGQRDSMPHWVKGMYYSDASTVGKVFTADQYMVCKNESQYAVVGFLSAFKHLSNIAVEDGSLVLNAILDSVINLKGSYELDPIYIAIVNSPAGGVEAGSYSVCLDFDKAFNQFMDLWAQYSEALPQRSFSLKNRKASEGLVDLGWCSWYQYFWDLKPSHIDEAIDEGIKRGYDLIQIDDGYQYAIGDWLDQCDEFKGDLERLVKKITESNMVAGIWTAPFLVGQNSNVFLQHPDWVVLDRLTGEPQIASVNPSWGGFAYALDTTNDDVLDFLTKTYSGLSQMGFDYHKIDFCYAGALDGIRVNDKKYSRAQALRMGLQAVREGIDDRYLLGCGCPFGPAVGIVDAMRVSADTAPYFEERIAWTGFNEASPSAYNALIASVLRANMNAKLFMNDPDCILLRTQDTMLDRDQLDLVMAVVAGVGNFEIISDNVKLLKDEDYLRLEKIRSLTGATGRLEIRNLFNLPLIVDSSQTRLVVDLWGKSTPEEVDKGALTQGFELVMEATYQNMWAKLFKKVS